MRPIMVALGLGSTTAAAAFQGPIRFDEPVVSLGGVDSIQSLAIEDFDGDGAIDVALTVGSVKERIDIGRNVRGVFVLHHSIERPAFDLDFIQAGDIDGDGDADLAWYRRDESNFLLVEVFFNDGTGAGGEVHSIAIGRRAQSLGVADLDADGDDEVIIGAGDRILVLEHLGGGQFEEREAFVSANPEHQTLGVVSGDFDLDGDIDIAALHAEGEFFDHHWKTYDTRVTVILNDGDATFDETFDAQLPWSHTNEADYWPSSLLAGDYDNDGDADLAVAATVRSERYYPTELVILINEAPAQVLTPRPIIEFGVADFGAHGIAADLDTDGDIDLAFVPRLGGDLRALYVLTNEEDAEFEFSGVYPTDMGDPSSAGAGDFDNDGQWDVIVASTGISSIRNSTRLDGPFLYHGPLVRGSIARFAVTDARPNELIHFLASFQIPTSGNGVAALGGATLDLGASFTRFGSASANAQGVARLDLRIPPTTPLGPVTLQAVIRRGDHGAESVKTPFHVGVITE